LKIKLGKRIAITTIVIVIAVALILSSFVYLNSKKPYSRSIEKITVGNLLYEYSGLLFVASDQGFFAKNGLDVSLINYTSSVASVKGVENGDSNIALVTEYSIVTEALAKENVSIIGTIDQYQSVFLICRADKGISNVSDLNGKKIGFSPNTIGEFYLGRFLQINGIPKANIVPVNLSNTQYVDALANGDVDAFVGVYTYLEQSKERLGSNIVAIPIQSDQNGYLTLTCQNEWIVNHPETINKFLTTMKQAEQYIISHPAESKAIVGKWMNYTDATMTAIWTDHIYTLSLDQSLLLAMQDEATWTITNKITNATALPNFLDYVYLDGLEAVDPNAVTIIY
jgi:NitT/TauT family transport system substrate-binding protein